MLQKTVLLLTWIWAITFLILESYVTLSWGGSLLESGYLVDVFGVGLMFWAIVSARRARPYATGLFATAWAWMTAVFWRATSLRFALHAEGEALYYGTIELWLGPLFTIMAGAVFVASLVLLLRQENFG